MKLVMVSSCTMRTTTTMLQARPRAVEYGRESVCHRTLYRVPTACHGVAAKRLQNDSAARKPLRAPQRSRTLPAGRVNIAERIAEGMDQMHLYGNEEPSQGEQYYGGVNQAMDVRSRHVTEV